jgi:hypothetical protein
MHDLHHTLNMVAVHLPEWGAMHHAVQLLHVSAPSASVTVTPLQLHALHRAIDSVNGYVLLCAAAASAEEWVIYFALVSV